MDSAVKGKDSPAGELALGSPWTDGIAILMNAAGTIKFIPVLRRGGWAEAVPTALNGVFGVDLRADSVDECRDLVRHLHGINEMRPVAAPPDWVHSQNPCATIAVVTPQDNWDQRKRLPESELGLSLPHCWAD